VDTLLNPGPGKMILAPANFRHDTLPEQGAENPLNCRLLKNAQMQGARHPEE
jgi:hypothetical protein